MSMMLALAMGVAGAAPATTDFEVGGAKFRLAIPAGFCLPQGAQVAQMARIAAADTSNVTNVSLIECGQTLAALPDLVSVKTLKMYETTPLVRESFIAQMAASLPLIEAPATQAKLMDQSEKGIANATGAKVDLSGALRARGRDSVCAYIAGTIDVAVGDRKVTGVLAACATVVDNRQMTIYRVSYAARSDGGAGLLGETRAIALAITPLAGK